MLEERAAVVTGGSRGIGFTIARELVAQGINVVVCSRNQEQVKKAVNELSKGGGKAYGISADVSSFKSCQKLFEFVLSKTGRADILINSAGIFGPVGLLETNNPSDWKEILATNVLGTVYCSKLAIPLMKDQGGGKIINLAGAGIGGPTSLPHFSGYYTSKAAVVSFTETLAAELQDFSIQVNAIAPGAVASELTLGLLRMDRDLVGEDMYTVSKQLEEGGGTSPELAARLVTFLVSKKANHITGRLISARWDSFEELEDRDKFTQNSYRLRRIDNKMFVEKK